MISLSRRNAIPGLTGDRPLCTNVLDYASDTADPSVPVPTQVSLTFNAPIKASFSSLGTSGFTSTFNSFGVSAASAVLPFEVSNPKRHQIKVSPDARTLTLTRYSDSPGTVFDTAVTALPLTKFQDGIYIRGDYPYLHVVYFRNKASNKAKGIAFISCPLKVLPQNPQVQGIATTYRSTAGVVTPFDASAFGGEDGFGLMTAVTSSQILDLEVLDNRVFPITLFDNFTTDVQVVIGVSSLTFTL